MQPLSLSDLTDPSAVHLAIAQYDLLGRAAFLRQHGYGPARGYYLVHEGRRYDSKAIVGVATSLQHPSRPPLKRTGFSGGEATVRRKLESLGFTVFTLSSTAQADNAPAGGTRRDGKIERSADMLLVGYALSRLGEARPGRADGPPTWLGAKSWEAAYDLFFEPLGDGRTARTFRFSLKNARDKFDPHLPSNRRGWLTPEGAKPPPVGWVRDVIETWASRSDSDLQAAVLEILRRPTSAATTSSEWLDARRRIEKTTHQTVRQSGTVQKRMLKEKELRCANLEATLDELFSRQGYRCAQTGLGFVEADPELRASLDRIDSDGHYEDGSLGDGPHNLQLVTHWYNIAKGVRSDAEMKRLLVLHAESLQADQIHDDG